jgi:hypothetical protein
MSTYSIRLQDTVANVKLKLLNNTLLNLENSAAAPRLFLLQDYSFNVKESDPQSPRHFTPKHCIQYLF